MTPSISGGFSEPATASPVDAPSHPAPGKYVYPDQLVPGDQFSIHDETVAGYPAEGMTFHYEVVDAYPMGDKTEFTVKNLQEPTLLSTHQKASTVTNMLFTGNVKDAGPATVSPVEPPGLAPQAGDPLQGYKFHKSATKKYPRLKQVAVGAEFEDVKHNHYIHMGPAQKGYVKIASWDGTAEYVVSDMTRVFVIGSDK